jgi:hypothetical protein
VIGQRASLASCRDRNLGDSRNLRHAKSVEEVAESDIVRGMRNDEEHLRLLTLFHYVLAGVCAFFACIPLIHVGLGHFMILSPESWADAKGGGPPAFMGWIFFLVGAVIVGLGWAYAACVLLAGRCLAKRKHWLFCIIIGGVECMYMPFGTVLGVFTIMVLTRESVKARFQETAAPTPQVEAPA